MRLQTRRLVITIASLTIFCSLAQAQSKFNRMISPLSNPSTFEDPRSETELRPIFMYHEINKKFAGGSGGNIKVYALQGRFALGNLTNVFVSKAGWYDTEFDDGLSSDSGLSNIAVGVKHAFHYNSAAGEIVTAGLKYEMPAGNTDVFQGRGDGVLNPFLSAGLVFPGWNMVTGGGLRVPLDSDDSTILDFDLHVDFPVGNFYPSLELGIVHVVDEGQRIPLVDEGADLINFGSSESGSNTLVTGTVGGRYKFSDSLNWGLGYQFPIGSGDGSNFLDWRFTTDLIMSIPENY